MGRRPRRALALAFFTQLWSPPLLVWSADEWSLAPQYRLRYSASHSSSRKLEGSQEQPSKVERRTWNGCRCLESWNDVLNLACNESCCNVDNDPLGEWCMVEESCDEDENGWGYCRPVGLTVTNCRDSPRDWRDADGDSCSTYASWGYCTITGEFGARWKPDWGNFQNFSMGGASALEACCSCGGGVAPRCNDTAGWADSDGDGCDHYVEHNWCNATGGVGLGWHEEWGAFPANANGVAAGAACCGCGGGVEEAAPEQPKAKGVPRITWNDCDCMLSWEEDGLAPCTETCCNPDNDPLGDWCKVKNPACEDSADWGYCRNGDATEAHKQEDGCTNLEGWKDPEGDGCENYQRFYWCTPTGTPGKGWHDEWGPFSNDTVNHMDAATACCVCGGGARGGTGGSALVTTTSMPLAAVGLPRFTYNGCRCKTQWEESGMKCESSCCNPDDDAVGEWCLVSDPACEDEDNPWGYCKPLGGTIERHGCDSDPPNWMDTKGLTCATYEERGYCTPSGGQGPEWLSSWGTFASFTTDGRGPDKACCGCGGGHQQEGCTDVQGWKDAENDGCKNYRAYHWCTEQGGQGKGWHEEWGRLPIGTGDIGPEQACCVCGGGNRPGGVSALPQAGAPRPPPAEAVQPSTTGKPSGTKQMRVTYNGCACMEQWEDLGMNCLHSCCNPDNDPSGDWCFVQDRACEESDWGYCRRKMPGFTPPVAPAGSGVGANCTDIEGWRDADGDRCHDYVSANWCTSAGDYGLGWHEEWGSFRSFSHAGSPTAVEACCGCGRGTAPNKVKVQRGPLKTLTGYSFASIVAISVALVVVGGGGWYCGRLYSSRDDGDIEMHGSVIGCKYQTLEPS